MKSIKSFCYAGTLLFATFALTPLVAPGADDFSLKLGIGELSNSTPLAISPNSLWLTSGTYLHKMARPDAPPHEIADSPTTVFDVAFSSDGQFVAEVGFGGNVVVYDVSDPDRIIARFSTEKGADTVQFSADSENITIAMQGAIQTWSIKNKTKIKEVKIRSREGQRIILSPDLKYAAAMYPSEDSKPAVQLWDVETGRKLKDVPFHSAVTHPPVFSPDSTTIAAPTHYPIGTKATLSLPGQGSIDEGVEIVDLDSLESVLVIKGSSSRLAYSANGEVLAIGASEKNVFAVNLKEKKVKQIARDLEYPASGLAVSTNGTQIAYAYPSNKGDHITVYTVKWLDKSVAPVRPAEPPKSTEPAEPEESTTAPEPAEPSAPTKKPAKPH